MGLDPGARDRRVTIQQRSVTDTATDSGLPAEPWATLATAWMRRKQLRQSERFANGQTSAPVDTEWEMDYRADMDPELVDVVKVRRLVFSGYAYDITEAIHVGICEGIQLATLGRKAA